MWLVFPRNGFDYINVIRTLTPRWGVSSADENWELRWVDVDR